jgi:hypothetical protein
MGRGYPRVDCMGYWRGVGRRNPSELLAVPVIVAAWIFVVVFLDRWVRTGVDQE